MKQDQLDQHGDGDYADRHEHRCGMPNALYADWSSISPSIKLHSA